MDIAGRHFGQNIEPQTFVTKPIVFGDFLKFGADPSDKQYEIITDFAKCKNVLGDVSEVFLGLRDHKTFSFLNLKNFIIC